MTQVQAGPAGAAQDEARGEGGVPGGDAAAAGGPDHGHAEGHGATGRLRVSEAKVGYSDNRLL